MTKKQFQQWLDTCPSHKYEIIIDHEGYVQVSFKVREEY